MVEEHFLTVKRSARVYTYGELSGSTEKIWIAAHGYGMLGSYFIKKFEVLDPKKHFVIVPEALSRAYLENMTGRVGASWMTSEMREAEISDYLNYLDKVIEEFTTPQMLADCKLIALGFSQGAATISRWVQHSGRRFAAMILWGGAPAKELFSVKAFENLRIVFAFGDKDVYLNDSNKESLREQCEEIGWSFEVQQYSGGHHLSSQLISSLGQKL
jgi:predicted esterase